MTTLRSSREIALRLKQELKNVYAFTSPPNFQFDPNFVPRITLPPPSEIIGALQGTAFEQEVLALAEQIRRHHFPILSLTIDTGPQVPWRRDHVSGIETGLSFFRRISYLDARRSGDHKIIWELNRHQHLVILAQAYYSRAMTQTFPRSAHSSKVGLQQTRFIAESIGPARWK